MIPPIWPRNRGTISGPSFALQLHMKLFAPFSVFFTLIISFMGLSALGDSKNGLPVNIVDICNQRIEFFKEVNKKQVSVSEVLSSAVSSKAQVIMWGESHFEDSFVFYPWTIEKLKSLNSKLDCLFIESDMELNQPDLDTCNSNPLRAFEGSFINPKFEEYLFKCSEEKPRSFVRDESVRAAYKLGMKVYALDVGQIGNDRDSRNQFMAKRVAQLMQRDCRFAVAINGMNHISSPPSHIGNSLPEYLRDKSISTYEILLAAPKEYSQISELWMWKEKDVPLCAVNPTPSNTTYGVLLKPFFKDSPIYWRENDVGGGGELSGHWKDFDAAVIFGNTR